MKHLYKNEWHYFKRDYFLPFLIVAIITLLTAIGAYWLLTLNPGLTQGAMAELDAHFSELGIDGGFEGDGGGSGTIDHTSLFWIILLNNLRVSLFVILFGFIPMLVLPALSPVVTASTVSILLAFVNLNGENPWPLFMQGIVPHGIVEMAGLILASAIGIFLSYSVILKLFSPNRGNIPLGRIIGQTFRSYALIVVPLIVIAAVIEGFVTPLFLS
ncbi:stage II sporulation protein M [Salsuginibacillus halophilus]|uniref:Stage II sporulation protein M n=1 Tax=Salsuginibacillus halophilus TaxID=517424 RepID=A0A2P8HE95_9BACI|nr:stage II sporulation protein M [Salsuginibacillus halophilus]PSL44491.1 stage II sporulation protein M [Salsuginibacillus halophilus]